MNVWMDVLSVLMIEWRLITVILVFVFIGQHLIHLALRPVFGDELTTSEYSSLSAAGWIAPVMFISLTWILWGLDHGMQFGLLILVIILLLLSRLKLGLSIAEHSRQRLKPASNSTSLIFALFIFISILLRLVYVSKALFPLYFDSAQHYALTKSIMGNEMTRIFSWPTVSYYHLGFHFLTAFFASFFHAEITRVMLILGQIILALIPFSLFCPIKHETRSSWAGIFAVILSAFGWYMPAHTVDWGKYPALMSLGLIPFVLCLAYLLSQNSSEIFGKKRRLFYGILGISVLLSIFTHSRSVIVLGIVFLAWIAATWSEKLSQRRMLFIVVIVMTLLEIIFIQRQSVLALLFDPYLQKGILITVFVLLLSIFAWMVYPRLTFICVLTITLLLAGLFIPVAWVPGYRNLTLLDRPFVEMILYMPLSMLGGLGLAGLEKKLQGRFSLNRYAGMFAIGIVAVNAFFNYDLYPSNCCVIVGNDDIAAMDWMANQLPADARIGISSTELKVTTSESSEGNVGADAGIWITPLTGHVTFPLPFDMGFDQLSTLERLCELGIGYVYVGEIGWPFNVAKITSRSEWYKPLLSMPKTGVYEVIGCDGT